MGLKDRAIGKMAQQMAPGMTKVLESIHVYLEAQLAVQKEILREVKKRTNPMKTWDEVDDEIKGILEKIVDSS